MTAKLLEEVQRRQHSVHAPEVLHPWAIYDGAARLVFLALASCEDDVWRWHLGWPDAEDIKAAKRRGLRASRVDVLKRE
jgi:hypothetical protein